MRVLGAVAIVVMAFYAKKGRMVHLLDYQAEASRRVRSFFEESAAPAVYSIGNWIKEPSNPGA